MLTAHISQLYLLISYVKIKDLFEGTPPCAHQINFFILLCNFLSSTFFFFYCTRNLIICCIADFIIPFWIQGFMQIIPATLMRRKNASMTTIYNKAHTCIHVSAVTVSPHTVLQLKVAHDRLRIAQLCFLLSCEWEIFLAKKKNTCHIRTSFLTFSWVIRCSSMWN